MSFDFDQRASEHMLAMAECTRHQHQTLVDGLAKRSGFELPEMRHMCPFPADCNPFNHDSLHMGVSVEGGWTVMYSSPDSDGALKHLIMVNSKTGQRFILDFTKPE